MIRTSTRYRKLLTYVLTWILFVQPVLTLFQVQEGRAAAAAASGPVLLNKNPADNAAAVPSNIQQLVLTFDEAIVKGSGSAAVSIRKVSDNTEVEHFTVSSDTRISIDPDNNAVVRIRPSSGFEVGGAYYVLIDAGAFVGAASGINFAGIAGATDWNFTVSDADTTPPEVTGYNPANGSSGNSVFSQLKIDFNEKVYPASGTVQIQNQSTGDVTSVGVVSSSVTGGGTSTIVITPPYGLGPDQTYRVTAPPGSFQDMAGNNAAVDWTFSTGPAPIAASFAQPADNSEGVDVNSPLQIVFSRDVERNSSGSSPKYITIKKITDNSIFQRINVSDVAVEGGTVTIPHSPLEGSAGYYVQIDAGAFKSGDLLFAGITDASAWNFSTRAVSDNQSVSVTKLEPGNGAVMGSLDGPLTMTFNKAVYPGSGTIVIRSASGGEIVTSIPVTSAQVTGGGTNQITIKPGLLFAERTAYYVQIGNQAFQDAAGNRYGGINDATSWKFTVSKDAEAPSLVSMTPANGSAGISTKAGLRAVFNEQIQLGAIPKVILHRSDKITEVYNASASVDPADSKALLIQPAGPLPGNTSIYVEIGVDTVKDLAGNAFAGILNEYQWTFKTLNSSAGAPSLSKVEMISSSKIALIYDKELDTGFVPYPAQYYVTVNDSGNARAVAGVSVDSSVVTLTLASGILNGQKVKVSYSQSSDSPDNHSLRSLTGDKATGFSGREAVYSEDQTQPKLLGGSVNGSMATLQFNEALAAADPNTRNQFTINVGGYNYGISELTVSGSTLSLKLAGAVTTGDSAYVSYTPGTAPLKDTAGNILQPIGKFYVQNMLDKVRPVLSGITVSGAKLILAYNEGLNPDNVPYKSQFSVMVNGSPAAISSVAVENSTLVLTLASAPAASAAVTVSYAQATPGISDLAGNTADSFSGIGANVSASTATMLAAIVNGNILQMTFSNALDPAYIPLANQFAIRADGMLVPVYAVSVSGNAATLTLNTPVVKGQSVLLSYTPTVTGLRMLNGNPIAGITASALANVTDAAGAGSGGGAGDGGADGTTGAAAGPGVLTVKDAQVTSSVSPAGKPASRYNLLNERVARAYQALRSSGSGDAVTFTVPSTESAGLVAVPLKQLEDALALNGNASFKVIFNGNSFEVPLKAVNYPKTASMLNAGGTVGYLLIQIDPNATALSGILQSVMSRSRAKMIVSPVSFEASVMSGTTIKPLEQFDRYVSFSVQAADSVDGTESAAVWVDSESGSLTYAPTSVTDEDGNPVVTFKQKGNGVYAVVTGSVTFADTDGHWAQPDIERLASKYIVSGRTTTLFEPKKAITRAEFAEFVARGLGLAGDKAVAASTFSDVSRSGKAAPYIGAVYNAGIVKGNADGTFKPDSPITRQEMAAMMIRAMESANQTVTLPLHSMYYVQGFKDYRKISGWAMTDVAKAVQAGIVNGLTAGSFGATDNATRAEAVLMVERMLKVIGFLDEA
ncbi:Ig-like domain-containing protein [Paenibacillus beijingensis]|uniref:SLH domain-containing protein n=1 Tax=Paenibacillus beijingensis TaxID=1126833 RepID=A0A0D5NHR4_9BACL|nr:Ig-like domain-containing protein [Paenibacillus beijingensis]AJY74522.1 hypothetical protein VN24_07995 [Paenibacillus beijingensis]